MVTPRRKKYVLAAVAAMVGVLVIGTIKIEVPRHLQGELVAHGRITHCDFRRLGRHGGEFFMGVTIDSAGTPYLRFQGRSAEKHRYEAMCARRPAVRITYHAVKRVFGPVRFWIDRVSEE